MEIPGSSYNDALQRYTYRMPEQANIRESFQPIMSRLRNFVDAPYIEGPVFRDGGQLPVVLSAGRLGEFLWSKGKPSVSVNPETDSGRSTPSDLQK